MAVRDNFESRNMALVQFGDCSPLNGRSVRDAPNSTFLSKVYAPEFCIWSKNWTKKGNNALFMTQTQVTTLLYGSQFGLLRQTDEGGFELAVQKIIQLCNPSPGVLQELPGFSFELSVAIIEFLDYMAVGLGKVIFEGRAKWRYHGMFMTRSVREILYGYYDPWLRYRFGDYTFSDTSYNSSSFVRQIHDINDIKLGLEDISTFQAYTGINTGTYNLSKLHWINQEAILSDAVLNSFCNVPLNAKSIQWQNGKVEVDSPSGAVFGKLQHKGNLTMWLSPWLRHVTLEYIGTGSQHGLKTNKYRMADSSLAACTDPNLEYVAEDGTKFVCLLP